MKDFIEKHVSIKRKKGRSLWKMEKKNDFHKLENHLFTSKNKLFLRLFTPNSNNGFY